MDILICSIFIFIIGLCFGSFYNVVGYRLPNKMSISFPPSHCPNCNHRLKPLELIPVLSFIIQGGKCKSCKSKISFFYPTFELLTGILFVLCFLSFKDTYPEILNIVYACLFTSSIIIIMISDIKYMIIPDEVLIFFGILLVGLRIFILYKLGTIVTILDAGYELIFMIRDAVIMFGIMYLIRLLGNFIFKKDSMGGGDIKLMAFIALVLGWELSIVVIFIGSFLALPISIINMYRKDEHMLPFGPYLGVAALILFLCKVDMNMIYNLLLFR